MGPGDRHDDEPLDEGPDDEHSAPRGAPPDPLDRVWVHPTELPPPAPSFVGSSPSAQSTGRRGATALLVPGLAGAAGALVTVFVLAVSGAFDRTSETTGTTANDRANVISISAVEAAAQLAGSIVAVKAHDSQGARQGTGLCVHHGNEILTTARLVGSAETVDIVTSDGRQHRARVVGRDRVTDLAVLEIDDDVNLPAARLARRVPASGARVWLLGAPNPGTTALWVSGGMISSNDAVAIAASGLATGGLLETDAASGGAAMGGALVDGDGNAAGIVIGRVNGGDTTYAIPIESAVAISEALRDTGVAKHGSLGIEGTDTAAGTNVAKVVPDGPAAAAGVQVGDIVIAVDGRTVDSFSHLLAIVRALEPGRTVTVMVSRDGEKQKVQVVVGETGG